MYGMLLKNISIYLPQNIIRLAIYTTRYVEKVVSESMHQMVEERKGLVARVLLLRVTHSTNT